MKQRAPNDVGNKFHADNIKYFLKGKMQIFDMGSGPSGSAWWQFVSQHATITGIDTLFYPKKLPKNVKIYSFDATKLADLNEDETIKRYHPRPVLKFTTEQVNWNKAFDMVVANHILEHVLDPEKVIFGMSKILKKEGIVYTGFPDGTNFTDTFYHLIHAEGGGHIQRLQYRQVKKLFEKYGFLLVQSNIWPDDWVWLQKLYDYKSRKLLYIDQKDMDYLANTFRKELTVKKGYFYGWEMVLRKK